MNNLPTPETDGIQRGQNVLKICGDLERRLTVARHALERLDNDLMRDAQRKLIIRVALTETAPKP